MPLKSINPATEEVIFTRDEFSGRQVQEEIERTHLAFLLWKDTSFKERSKLMFNAAKVLRNKIDHYARIMVSEMGKPIKQAFAEVDKCAWVCEYYAKDAEKILSKEIVQTDASESYVQFDPLGVVLAIMPWNFPFWQVFRFAAPGLMAGNAALLKHASNVSMCSLAIEEVFREAGFPENLFKSLLIGNSGINEIINNPKVAAVTLTGSDAAGRKVAGSAGNNLKKTVLELGGSDPFIVLKDADIDRAAHVAVAARIINNGQSCIAAKRFIVEKEIAHVFERKFVERVNELRIGDPLNEVNEIGPIAREDLLNDLNLQVTQSIEKGAKLLAGGKRLDQKGFYYQPTVLSGVRKGMPAYEQETFGPVAALITAEDEEDAISIANHTQFGLGANLWTANINRAKELAHQIESGSVFINGNVKSDPRLPFGGIKASGYGRELSSYGIKEFVNIKSVWIA